MADEDNLCWGEDYYQFGVHSKGNNCTNPDCIQSKKYYDVLHPEMIKQIKGIQKLSAMSFEKKYVEVMVKCSSCEEEYWFHTGESMAKEIKRERAFAFGGLTFRAFFFFSRLIFL